MKVGGLRPWALVGMFALCGSALAVPPPLPAEHLTVERLPPASPHWVYVYDEALNNEIDSRLFLYDADHHRRLGQIDAGFYAGFALSPDHKTVAVATTYWSRGGHGTRTEVIEFSDTSSLSLTGEVVLPPKRAQGPPTSFNIAFSRDQRLIYSTNLTPAASLTTIDYAKREVLGEIDTDGCVMAIPSLERRVSSICESGRLLSIVVDDSGHEVSRSFSDKFFDVDHDPVFVQAVPSASGVVFLSFLGRVHSVDLTVSEPKFTPPWSLVPVALEGQWRPGGTQMGALHRGLGRLYVTMHPGGPGTHKDPGPEVWVFDVAKQKRLGRWKVDTRRYGKALGVQVSQDEHPLLFVLTDTSYLLTMDARSGRLLHAEPKMGQTPWYMINP